MMTRKDYIITAEILNAGIPHDKDLVLKMAGEFANYFKKDNPRFDRTRFFDAVKKDW
jgi:hypothetical protein